MRSLVEFSCSLSIIGRFLVFFDLFFRLIAASSARMLEERHHASKVQRAEATLFYNSNSLLMFGIFQRFVVVVRVFMQFSRCFGMGVEIFTSKRAQLNCESQSPFSSMSGHASSSVLVELLTKLLP